MRFGEPGGLFLRDPAAQRAAFTLGSHLALVLHRHVRFVRHPVHEKLLQVGRLRGRREIRLEDGEAVSSGLDVARYRRDRQVLARGQHAQQ